MIYWLMVQPWSTNLVRSRSPGRFDRPNLPGRIPLFRPETRARDRLWALLGELPFSSPQSE